MSLLWVANEVELVVTMLGPESQLAPQLQTLYVGAELENVAGGALERCFAKTAAV